MALPLIQVTGFIRMPNGDPMANVTVRFTLSHAGSDLTSNTVVLPHKVEFVTNNNGLLTANLWSNDRGFENTMYTVVAFVPESGVEVPYRLGNMQVLENGSTDLEELLTETVIRSLTVDEMTLAAALRSETAAGEAAADRQAINPAQIEANALAAAQGEVASLKSWVGLRGHIYYVDQANGDDTNDGTSAAPLQSIQRASRLTPTAGHCSIKLVGDYLLDEVELVSNTYVEIIGQNQPKITLGWVPDTGNPGQFWHCGQIRPAGIGGLLCRDLDIALPAAPGGTHVYDHMSGFYSNSGTAVPSLLSAKFSNVNFTHNNYDDVSLFGRPISLVVCRFSGCTFQSGFEGRLRHDVGGVGVGRDTVLRQLNTNTSWV